MKKGVIVDIKNRQKVVLADNGRFYVSSLKKGEAVGSRVSVGLCRRHVAALGICAAFCVTAFFAGMFTMHAMRAQVPELLIQFRAVSGGESRAAVEMITNFEGKLLSAAPVDTTGETLMAGESFEGLQLDTAIQRYLDIAAECGFLDVLQGSFIAVSSYSQHAEKADEGWHRALESIRNFAYIKRYKVAAFRARAIYPAELRVSGCAENFWVPLYIAAEIQRSEGAETDITASITQLKSRPGHAVMGIIESAHKRYKQDFGGERRNRLLIEKQSLKNRYQAIIEQIKNLPLEGGFVWNTPQIPSSLQSGIAIQVPIYTARQCNDADS